MQGPVLLPSGLDWVIAGPQSGPRAVVLHQNWARDLRDQCTAMGAPFFLKGMALDGVEYKEFPK
jgi:protein gp37